MTKTDDTNADGLKVTILFNSGATVPLAGCTPVYSVGEGGVTIGVNYPRLQSRACERSEAPC